MTSPTPPDQVTRAMLAEVDRLGLSPGRVAVVDDVDAALLVGTAERWPGATLRLHCDLSFEEATVSSAAESAGIEFAVTSTIEEALAGAEVCLFRLPPALAALELITETAADHGSPELIMIGGGRAKHLNRSMNEVMARRFAEVRGSLGVGKARALIATGSRPGTGARPRTKKVSDGLSVVAYGGVFAGAALDPGTALLLGHSDRWPSASIAVDAGCGTGLLAVALARRSDTAPDAASSVIAIDASAVACRSAVATAEANGIADRIEVRRADGLGDLADGSVGLIVSNPPFHRGTAKDCTAAFMIIEQAGRVLAPEGELWLVYNTHLPYRSALRRHVGPTEVVVQDRSYVVTRSVRAASGAASIDE